MEFIQNLFATVLLGVWVVGSSGLVVALVQNIIHDRNQEKREAARADRDKEYHDKRMKELR